MHVHTDLNRKEMKMKQKARERERGCGIERKQTRDKLRHCTRMNVFHQPKYLFQLKVFVMNFS